MAYSDWTTRYNNNKKNPVLTLQFWLIKSRFQDTDMAITAIIMTADKEEVVDFVAPYYEQSGITIGKFHIRSNNNKHRHTMCV